MAVRRALVSTATPATGSSAAPRGAGGGRSRPQSRHGRRIVAAPAVAWVALVAYHRV
ncbi:hypothetical protein [Spongiactinospora gelatinilytica]|uniref:hypothetical protein n=1 Tax=Spongiactinospora gelatinilytica TaxID=2666298 RepID=UPI0013146CF5|nr:hypothetical protein [Spongiactinospora gelatinilytica]